MEITLQKEVVEAIGPGNLVPFGYTEDKMRWGRDMTFDLANQTKHAARKFREVLATASHLPRVGARLKDVDRWLQILDGETVKCKKIKHFDAMLKQYLKTVPKHWLYEQRPDSDVHQPYYVSGIAYHPPERDRDGYTSPAYVTISFHYEELGVYRSAHDTFYAEDCEDLTVGRALAEKGYQTETPELLASYEANKKKYVEIHNKVGLQFTAVGVAEEEEKKESYWYRRVSNIKLDRDGVPSRVVVDLLYEDDKDRSAKDRPPSSSFWSKETCDHEGSEDDDDKDIKPGDEDDEEDLHVEDAQVPLWPSLMCFDLKRHTRLKIYVDQLTEYRYQTDLAKKLILPAEVTDLVNMLVAHKGGFKDIVGNKGAGAVILCAGPPGTGKTLTSEVYSEAMQRPLYSVQCSQLGVNPEELETQLMKTFARAQRWNAILLLDEADVYVARRGADLTQNAIVGVFLRVLEYYGGILFLTTNRADLVDDAIASRCLARIDYKVPTPDDQRRIWRTLADTAGIPLKDSSIVLITKQFPNLSGRDVKNLLKLASMVSRATDKPVTADTVAFVKQFKPTSDPE